MFRLAQKPVSYFSFALILVAVPIWWRLTPPASLAMTTIDVSAAEKQVLLLRAGLDARSFAAAGVSSNAISASVQALSTYLLSHPTMLSSADSAVATTRNECDRLLRLIQAGKATEEDVSQYQMRKSALATATGQQGAVLNAIFEATAANLTQQQRATLSTIRANVANSEVGIEFRTVNRSKSDWMQLRDDLAAERILAAHGDALFQAGAERLATARANGAVAAARTALTTNLASITSTLNAALAGQ